jgi:serine/threonine protein kinase
MTASNHYPHEIGSYFMTKKGSTLVTTFERYEIVRSLGAGGGGDVFLATDSGGAEAAVKLLRPGQSMVKRNRFKNELSFCASNVHPRIIRVLDRGVFVDKNEEQPFYVMPLYKSTLRKYLGDKTTNTERLELFAKILDGVEAAHLRGIFHRDLKPENILLNPGTDDVVVADFGIAHFEEDDVLNTVETSIGERLASWEYAAPEQRRAGLPVDHRADIYSLGLILTELLTGEVPHGADPTTIVSVAPEYPYLDDIVRSMRQHAPERRPNSIAEIKNLLIARNLDFVQQQQIDFLKQTVIPTSVVTDPLVDDPIKLIDVDYRNYQLVFTVSRAPNSFWIRLFYNQGSYSFINGSEPQRFVFEDATARVPVKEESAQLVVAYFKTFIHQTNSVYALEVKTQIAANEERKRRELREKIEREEKELAVRQRVKAKLSW